MGLTTKLLLVALSCGAGLGVGVFFARRVNEMRDFYDELLSFANSVSSDISFRQDGIRAVAQTLSSGCKSKLKHVLMQYGENPSRLPDTGFLGKSDRITVERFFSGLGKSDILTERNELENVKVKIRERLDYYREKSKKRSSMYIKLGLLSGLAVGILML